MRPKEIKTDAKEILLLLKVTLIKQSVPFREGEKSLKPIAI